MSTRIRYARNPNGTIESKQVFKGAGGEEYVCMLSADGKEGYVLTMPNKEVKMVVKGTSPHKTKIAIKSALKALSVVFLNEKRSGQNPSTEG